MKPGTRYTTTVALIVALGGFLMGFDAAVIAGYVLRALADCAVSLPYLK